MNRAEIKYLLPILQAFAEGKTLQIRKLDEETWYDTTKDSLNFNLEHYAYRVKSSPKYRPFKSAEECWQEMQKHQPFGWVKSKSGYELITCTMYDDLWLGDTLTTTERMFNDYTFADGTPFGIKEED